MNEGYLSVPIGELPEKPGYFNIIQSAIEKPFYELAVFWESADGSIPDKNITNHLTYINKILYDSNFDYKNAGLFCYQWLAIILIFLFLIKYFSTILESVKVRKIK